MVMVSWLESTSVLEIINVFITSMKERSRLEWAIIIGRDFTEREN